MRDKYASSAPKCWTVPLGVICLTNVAQNVASFWLEILNASSLPVGLAVRYVATVRNFNVRALENLRDKAKKNAVTRKSSGTNALFDSNIPFVLESKRHVAFGREIWCLQILISVFDNQVGGSST